VKILWFDHGFSCPTGSGGTRSYQFARNLVDAGHEVTIVCATEFMSSSGLTGPFRSDRREGSLDNIRIIEFNLAGGVAIGHRLRARLRYAAALAELCARTDADLIVSTSASLSGVFPAIFAKLFRGKPFVFDARSRRSSVDRARGLSFPPVTWLMSALEACAYRAASEVIATGDNIAEVIGECGVERFNVEVVPLISDRGLCGPCERMLPSDVFPTIRPDSLVAVFSGRIETGHRLDDALDAAELLMQRGRNDIDFLLIGDGAGRSALAKAVSARQLNNVTIAGTVGRDQLAPILDNCDIGLQLLEADPDIHAGATPEAFAGYLAARLPILINYPGWIAGLVAQHDCGYALRPGEPAAFADALENAADHRGELDRMANNAATLELQEFDGPTLLKAFQETLEDVVLQAQARNGQASKRIVDICLALAGLMITAPLMIAIAALVRVFHARPVFYRESCPGLFGRPIELIRFRTLRDAYRLDGGTLSDEERHTFFGRFLEATSLASLPLLWNVLRGDISFVGPRPLPMQDLSRLSNDAFHRQFVRPGLTGWAQIHSGSLGEALARDVWYVENRSLMLDLKILLMSVLPPLRPAAGAGGEGLKSGTMEGEGHHNDQAAL
jgi:lipopolysaccharide/colanic/teichoic acid biosynthesis glycosyltransferase